MHRSVHFLLLAATLLPFPASAIVDGGDADQGEHPWMATLFRWAEYEAWNPVCGAVLIDTLHVLTAAHCVHGYEYRDIPFAVHRQADVFVNGDYFVRFDTVDRSTRPDEGGPIHRVEAIEIHPEFGWNEGHTPHHDIAILRLSEPAQVPAVARATDPDDPAVSEGTSATALGWGNLCEGCARARYLQEVDIPILADETCQTLVGSTPFHADAELCALAPDARAGICRGDSGGPLVVPDGSGGWILGGITSWREHCDDPASPSVFAEVAAFDEFITGFIEDPPLQAPLVPRPAPDLP